ncbi:MAG: hypothetical protein HXY38_15005 [Chloroflexi bacterium]|nr:hypothetical protein [Chloroflexota bacterium]
MTTDNRTPGWIPLSSFDLDATGLACRFLGRCATGAAATYGTIIADYNNYYEVEIDGKHHFVDASKMVNVSVWW